MTVKDLKKLLANYPDNIKVYVNTQHGPKNVYVETAVYIDGEARQTDKEPKEATCVLVVPV